MKVRVLEKKSREKSVHQRLGEVKEYFDSEFNRWMKRYEKAMDQVKGVEIDKAHRELSRIAPLRQTVRKVFCERRTYQVSSWLLSDAYRYLTELPEEGMCFVAGQKLRDGSYTLERMLRLEYEMRTRGGAKGDLNSVAKALMQIDRFGGSFTAYLHSHPFKGRSGTQPSGIDFSFQERLERGGHVCIGGIFSRDGHVRFFSLEDDFRIEVTGKGVRKYEGKLFQITDEA